MGTIFYHYALFLFLGSFPLMILTVKTVVGDFIVFKLLNVLNH